MAGSDPGERISTPPGQVGRRLTTPPSARYVSGRGAGPTGGDRGDDRGSALKAPLLRAIVVTVFGAAALLFVGAILASTAGLLFTAGFTGGAIGLVLARAAVPSSEARPTPRRTVVWLAVALSIGAVGIAAVATWVVALGEGGTLGLLDYLLDTFGPFIPGEALIAAIAAAWGASAGPVQS